MLDRPATDRVVDVASVVLISIAAVLSALCGYQSGRWSGEEGRFYNLANASRVQSAEDADRAMALTAIDVNLFLHYVDAVDARHAREAAFIYRRFRPEMRAATAAWLATKPLTNPAAPSSPFAMPQYKPAARTASVALERQAAGDFRAAQAATRNSDDFLLLTVIFAAVSFLGGISTKMSFPRHAVVVTLGTVALIYGAVRLGRLPFL
jgi:hypothetical protein